MQASPPARPVRILETTLRDGTYEIDFQFSIEDTAFLASALDRAGFSYIEVSHGNGSGSERWPKRAKSVRALANDEAHITAAASVVKNAKLAAMIVAGPRFAPIDELDRLRGLGVDIIRIAYEWQEMGDAANLAYIDHAKKLGFLVSVNVMQTYNATLETFAAAAREMENRGTDWLYIVDSAGGMSAAEVGDYVRAVLDTTKLEVGLHAHNNSGLAIANSLAAVAAGATLVDTTLQGIGRATGNPSTEQTVLALQKLGHEQLIDRELVMTLGDLARSLFAEKGNDPTHFISGSAMVHSRNVQPLLRKAAEQGRPARELVLQVGQRLGQRGKALIDDAAMATIADGVAIPARKLELSPKVFEILGRGIERSAHAGLAQVSEELFARSKKRRKLSAIYLAAPEKLFFGAAQPWESAQLVGATVPFGKDAALSALAEDRIPAVLAYDPAAVDAKLIAGVAAAHRLALPLTSLLAEATADLAGVLAGGGPVSLRGDDAVGKAIELRLRERGIAAGEGQVVVCPSLSPALVEACRPGQTLVVYGRSDERGAVAEVRRRGARVLRPFLAPVIAARIEAMVALETRLAASLDPAALFGVQAVDVITAPAGHEVVVDGLTHPTTVLDCEPAALSRAAVEVARRRVESWLAGKGPI
jgi:4-hydroxy-2-oxovalerate aldolase